jgi:hypothetical protein
MTGALPALLRNLQPAALARLVDRIGLNDAGEVMALAPTHKLLQALDESLWKSPQPGVAETFDAGELVDWLEAWIEIGDTFAAERLAAMSDDYRALCLSHLVSVRIHHTLAFLAIPDDEVDRERDTLQPIGSCAFYGPYMVVPVAEDEWEVARAALDALWTERPECLLHTLGMLDGAEREELLIPQDTLLLADQRARRHRALTAALSELAETDFSAFERCARELAYLANVIKVGVPVKGAPMSDAEARDTAYAACNRGLQLARKHGLEVRIAQEPGLIRLFALGWRARHAISRSQRSGRARSARSRLRRRPA